MTTLPPEFGFTFDPPPSPGARRFTVATAAAWLVILACTALIMTKPRWSPARGGAATRPAIEVKDVRSPTLLIAGRYAVGAKAAFPAANIPTASLAEQVASSAQNPVDELRAITVIGELTDTAGALKHLDTFEKEHAVVRLREDVDALRRLYTAGPRSLTADQKQHLLDRHGWFGQLALSKGLPDTDPARQAALRPAKRTAVAAAVAMVAALAAGAVGLVLLVLAIVRISQRRLSTRYAPDPDHAAPFAEAFAVYLVGMMLASLAFAAFFRDAGLWPNLLLTGLLALVVGWLRFRRVPWPGIRHGLGWHTGRGTLREMGAGVVAYLAGLPVVGVGLLVSLFLMKLSGTQASHPIQNQPIDNPGDAIMLLVLAAVWAPVVEETMFRGALFHHLRGFTGWLVSAAISSLIFAAIHPQGWAAIPVLASLAVVFAAMREWRGSIVPSMTAHALHNGVLVTLMILILG